MRSPKGKAGTRHVDERAQRRPSGNLVAVLALPPQLVAVGVIGAMARGAAGGGAAIVVAAAVATDAPDPGMAAIQWVCGKVVIEPLAVEPDQGKVAAVMV